MWGRSDCVALYFKVYEAYETIRSRSNSDLFPATSMNPYLCRETILSYFTANSLTVGVA
jgi:hypothetical protein